MTRKSCELDVIASSNYLKGATWASFAYTQRSAAFITIMVFVLLDHNITADKVFTIYQYFSVLQFTLAALFPRGLQFWAEAKVSVKRIEVMSNV